MTLTAVCGIICFAIVSYATPIHDNERASSSLETEFFGYFEEGEVGAITEHATVSDVLRNFQRLDGLAETDVLVRETIASRNGVKSIIGNSAFDRKKRYAHEGQSSNTPPDLCQDASIDAITRTQDGSTYVFKGNFYWKVLSNGLAAGYPRRISDDWGGLEGNLDACVTWPDGKTYFFKDRRYWSTTNRHMDSGYPKILSTRFEGIPDFLDAAFIWSGNGNAYFFKGHQYWRYDNSSYPPVNEAYPIRICGWKGLPTDSVDAAFVWDNNVSYFFKGDQYYRFDDETSAVYPGYPKSTAKMWFGC